MKLNWHPTKNNPILMVLGPTGVGKTELTLHFLKNFFINQLEIISADSMQVYRGMDVGTAKPTSDEQALVPHHFIDICDPDEQFDAGQFVEAADVLTREIQSRGHCPLMTGGTGYYFKNFLFGLPQVPNTNQLLARQIAEFIDKSTENRSEKFALLQKIDPKTASRIHINDTYRLSRALECYQTNGRALSTFEQPEKIREGFTPIIIGLNRPREELYERIEHRVSAMFEAGLVEEVVSLRQKGFTQTDPGMKGIGYREFFEAWGEDDSAWYEQKHLLEIKEAIIKDSRHYAKKQLTYFKLIPQVHWFNPEDYSSIEEFLKSQFEA